MTMVWMHNEETGGYSQTTDDAFELVWSKKGWVLQDPPPEAVEEMQEIAEAQIAAPGPVMLDIFHPASWSLATVPEDSFNEAWEPLGWVRAAHSEDGTPTAPPEFTPPETGTGDTATAEQAEESQSDSGKE